MEFCVEVLTVVRRQHVIKRELAKSFADSLTLAQSMAVQMFPEDPMASRVFRAGQYVYVNVNDLGDAVSIRPMVFRPEDMKIVETIDSEDRRPEEPA